MHKTTQLSSDITHTTYYFKTVIKSHIKSWGFAWIAITSIAHIFTFINTISSWRMECLPLQPPKCKHKTLSEAYWNVCQTHTHIMELWLVEWRTQVILNPIATTYFWMKKTKEYVTDGIAVTATQRSSATCVFYAPPKLPTQLCAYKAIAINFVCFQYRVGKDQLLLWIRHSFNKYKWFASKSQLTICNR